MKKLTQKEQMDYRALRAVRDLFELNLITEKEKDKILKMIEK